MIDVAEIQKTRCLRADEFEEIRLQSAHLYPVEENCWCDEFKAGVPKWFQIWGRIRGDDKGSPLVVEGCGVLALCEHMAHTLACDAIKYANYPCAKSSRVNLKTVCKNYKIQPRARRFRFGLFSHNHTPK